MKNEEMDNRISTPGITEWSIELQSFKEENSLEKFLEKTSRYSEKALHSELG